MQKIQYIKIYIIFKIQYKGQGHKVIKVMVNSKAQSSESF